METMKNELLAKILLKVIDENRNAQESIEEEIWKLGYQEACEMVLELLNDLQNG